MDLKQLKLDFPNKKIINMSAATKSIKIIEEWNRKLAKEEKYKDVILIYLRNEVKPEIWVQMEMDLQKSFDIMIVYQKGFYVLPQNAMIKNIMNKLINGDDKCDVCFNSKKQTENSTCIICGYDVCHNCVENMTKVEDDCIGFNCPFCRNFTSLAKIIIQP